MSESANWCCPDHAQQWAERTAKKTKSERIAELEKKVSELEAQLTQHKMAPHWVPYYPWWNWSYPPYHPGYYGTIPCGTGTGTLTTDRTFGQNTAGWTTTTLSSGVVSDSGVPHV